MTAEPFPRELDSIDDREISAALVGQSPNTSERTPSLHFNREMTPNDSTAHLRAPPLAKVP